MPSLLHCCICQTDAFIIDEFLSSGQKLEDVMRRVEDMIIYEIDEEAERQQEVKLFKVFLFLPRIQVFNKNYVNFISGALL